MFKKIWPYLLLFVVWFIFASPYFLKGKIPYPSTYQVNFFAPWSNYPELSSPVKNNAMPDIIGQIYPWKHLTIQTYLSGQVPLWNPYSFSGTAHLANYQTAVLSPFNLLFAMLPFIDAWSVLVLLQPLLAGLFMYLLARSLLRSKVASLISSVSFMFCGFITTWMGYATLGYAILFLPLALLGVEKYFQTNKKKFLLLMSISFPLSFFSGHFQISLYFALSVSIYILIKFLLTKESKKTLNSFLYLFFGLLISMPQLLPSVELYNGSLRSVLFQKAEAIPLTYLPTFLSPDFFGNPVTRNDWFGHYAEWNAYIGVIPFILAIYSVINRKTKQTLYLFIFGILSLLLAFDTPVLSLLVTLKIPVLATSAASRIIVVYSFIFSLLSSFGFDELTDSFKNKKLKSFYYLLVVIFISFVSLWGVILFKIIPDSAVLIARQNMILPTLLFIAFVFFSFILLKVNKKSMSVIIGLILLFLVFLDMARFATKWMPFDPRSLVFKETDTLIKLRELSGYERFLGNLGGEVYVYYGLPSVEGYDAVYQKRYGELISYLNEGRLKTPERSVVNLPKRGEFTGKGINLLGIKYIVHKKADAQAIWAFPYWEYKKGSFTLFYEDDKYQIYENNNVLPRVFLVNNYKVLKNDKEILETMFSEKFDLKKELVLEKDIPLVKSVKKPGEARIEKYLANKITISVNANTDSLLFLSDSFSPGWKAFVDEKEIEVYRANYDFRAVYVTKGKHSVQFIYEPDSFKYGLFLAALGSLLLFLFTLPKKKISKS
jgi:uncharacterized membrane protein YfhO